MITVKERIENIDYTYVSAKGGVVLRTDYLDLGKTLDCGQAFRWEKIGENRFAGYYLNRPLTVSGADGEFLFENVSLEEFESVWFDYFDLSTDWGEIRNRLSLDPTLKAACEHCAGLRILNQDSWETLVSFIISQNNNIPRIKGVLARLTEHFGGFPSAEMLALETEESLAFLHSGYRARYLVDAAQKVSSGEIDLAEVKKMSYPDAKKTLMNIVGVGPKVADCSLLYGFGFYEAFPIDVWIKHAVARFYPTGLPECADGMQGLANLFLFDYIRSLSSEE